MTFVNKCLTSIGEESLNSISTLFLHLFIESPLWVISSKDKLRRAVEPLLPKEIKKTDERTILPALKEGSYDAVVACGDYYTIQLAKEALKEFEIALIVIPFGQLSARECHPMGTLIPRAALFDGRVSALTTKKEIAQSMCVTLCDLLTTLYETEDVLIQYIALMGVAHSHDALTFLDKSIKRASLSSSSALCVSALIASNCSKSPITEFAESFTIEGFSHHYQSSAALLPLLAEALKRRKPQLWNQVERENRQFISTWIKVAEVGDLQGIMTNLYSVISTIITDSKKRERLKPLLKLSEHSEGAYGN